MQFNNILCVCTGNICRSPLAEGLLRRDAPDLTVSSAGIGAVVGGRMPAEAAAIAEREGLRLGDHRGQQLVSQHVRSADVILVMEKGQRDWVVGQFPMTRGRVFLATHWVDGEDVDDPYQHDAVFFERVFQQLEKGIQAWVAKLQTA